MSLLIPLLVIVPGIGATLAIFKPGQARLPLHLACCFGLGQATLVSWGFLLAVLRLFGPVTFYGGLSVITIGFWVVGLRRGGPNARSKALREDWKDEPVLVTVSLIAILIFSFALMQSVSPLVNLDKANPLRYWSDGIELADAGRVPEATLQWGELYPPTVSKLGFNAFNGAFSYLTDDPLGAMAPLLAVGMVGAVFAGWALGRELGLRYTAPLLTILAGSGTAVFRHSLIISPQNWYGGEAFARLSLITGIALAVHALHNRDRRAATIAAGVALGAAGMTHLVPTVVGIGLLTCYALFYVLVERSLKQVVTVGLVVGAVFSSFLVAGLLLSGGDAAFNRLDKDQAIDTQGGTFDPTHYFATGRVDQPPEIQPGPRAEMNDGWYVLPGDMFDEYVSSSISNSVSGAATFVVFIGIGVAALALLFVGPKELRPIAVTGFALWAGVFLVSLFMSYTYDTYVPGAFPQRRLWSYDTSVVLITGLGAAEVVLYYLVRVHRWIPVAAVSLVMILVIAMGLPRAPSRIVQRQGMDTLRAMSWISTNLPCDARILANQRTGGTFQALTGRIVVTEGMAPYLRPDMLDGVTELLLDARRFFASPGENEYVLGRYGIDYIVVAKKKYLLDRSPALIGRPEPALVGVLEDLEQIHMSRLMDVYRVPGVDTSGWPQPEDHPGYRCRTEPLDIPSLAA